MFNSSRTLRFLPVLTLCILAACGGSSSSGDDPTDTGSTTATEDTDRRDGGTEDTENDDIGMADTSDLDADEADGGEEEACADPVEPPGRTYEATIRWTQYGVPHVTATDHGSVIFGQAWAVATDHVCTIADQIVRVRSERARYFGPGEDGEHIRSDMGWRVLGVHDEAACRLGTLSAVSLEALHGYVAGYNAYIAQADLPEACAGAPWVKPIDAVDLYAYHIALAVQASGGVLLDFIADTRPPGASKPSQSRELPDLRDIGLGSNGWALGAEKTASGRGMVMGNPHFPWEGALRFHEIHLTIPGELDVYGAAPPGLAGGVILGFNKDVAWTHTVSNSSRLTLYTLDIAPDDPTAYLVDGEVVKMTRKDIAIEVLQEDGSLVTEERDYYYSTYGPIVNLGPVAWNSTLAVTYRDANINNDKLIDTWHALNRADSIAAVQAAHQEHTGIPWVNTLAADREGNTFYIDSTAVPNMSPEAIAWWLDAVESDPLIGLAWSLAGVFAFDGSNPEHAWVEAPGARSPGLVPTDAMPSLERRDFVLNANDSHWLTHPDALLEGYTPLFGMERTPRSPRTRMNMVMMTEVGPNAPAGEDGRFTRDELKSVLYNGRGMIAELLLDAVLDRCNGVEQVMFDDEPVDIREACTVLGAWDGRVTTTSRGAHLWRELFGRFGEDELLDAGRVFSVPFDPDSPIATPHTLATPEEGDDDPILTRLAQAILTLQEANIPLDAELGTVQFTLKGDTRIPIPGGHSDYEGIFNMSEYRDETTTVLPSLPRAPMVHDDTYLTEEGYLMNYGTSFFFIAEFTEEGVEAEGVTVMSQSSDPRSPHFSDQSDLYSQGQLKPLLFNEADIAADPNLRTIMVQGED